MVKLSRILYIYLVQYPSVIAWNLLQRFLYYVRPDSMMQVGKGIMTDNWMASNKFLKAKHRTMQVQAVRETELNEPAIDVKLLHLEKQIEVSLLDFMKENRYIHRFSYSRSKI